MEFTNLISDVSEIKKILFGGNKKPLIVQLAKSQETDPMIIVQGNKAYNVDTGALYDAMTAKRKTFSDTVVMVRDMYVFTLEHEGTNSYA